MAWYTCFRNNNNEYVSIFPCLPELFSSGGVVEKYDGKETQHKEKQTTVETLYRQKRRHGSGRKTADNDEKKTEPY